MTDVTDDKKEGIEVRVKKGAADRTVKMADQMNTLLNSPIFAEMVRKAVEEMCLEGRLVYDMKKDSFMESEDLAKEFALRTIVPKKRSPTSKKRSKNMRRGRKDSTKELAQ
ncbi:MAG: hypothetical protein MUC62_02965 [Candidatus Thermoplasmatota archaeon]|jgi:hypothetical protein|nr:hypothetical protein [Candidatus Thermoplasmatota archaeon]